MIACECPYLPERYHYVYYGIAAPESMQEYKMREYNPHRPVHGEHHERKPMNNTITYTGPIRDHTIITLTDGSTVGAEGDITEDLNTSFTGNRAQVINQPNGMRITINPQHIVHAVYSAPLAAANLAEEQQ